MKSLYFNPETNVIFGSDEPQTGDIQAISNISIPDLIANGATVDASANDVPNASVSSTGTANESSANADALAAQEKDAPATGSATAEVPNEAVSGAASESEASTVVSAPAASGASVVAASPEDLAALHPGTTAGVSYSETPGSGDSEKDTAMLENSTAIVGAGNMHLNAHQTDATGTTGTVAGQPVLSNATAGYTATLTPPVADTGATSDHPAHGLLTRLWASLEGNSLAGEARELILKIRETL